MLFCHRRYQFVILKDKFHTCMGLKDIYQPSKLRDGEMNMGEQIWFNCGIRDSFCTLSTQ